jgi:hypothetical protein
VTSSAEAGGSTSRAILAFTRPLALAAVASHLIGKSRRALSWKDDPQKVMRWRDS